MSEEEEEEEGTRKHFLRCFLGMMAYLEVIDSFVVSDVSEITVVDFDDHITQFEATITSCNTVLSKLQSRQNNISISVVSGRI
jgi:hypothetical protein